MLEDVGFLGGMLFIFAIFAPFYFAMSAFINWLGDTPQRRETELERKYGVDYRIHCEKKFGKNWRTILKVDYSDV